MLKALKYIQILFKRPKFWKRVIESPKRWLKVTHITGSPHGKYSHSKTRSQRVAIEMWVALLLILTLPLLAVAYLQLTTYRRRKILKKFNGPKGLPLIGNAHQMGKNPSGGFAKQFSLQIISRGYTQNDSSRIAL